MPTDDKVPKTPKKAQKAPVAPRRKPVAKENTIYLLKLTEPQRKSLENYLAAESEVRLNLVMASSGAQVLRLTRAELELLSVELKHAVLLAPASAQKQIAGVFQLAVQTLMAGPTAPSETDAAPAQKTDLIYQFKIALLEIVPPIWRRIRVPDCTLSTFHYYIQAAMGWDNDHMHQFEIDGQQYGDTAHQEDVEEEEDVLISQLVPTGRGKPSWIYEYDFGDGWQHEILYEGASPADPKAKRAECLEGERACPPEDSGGPYGYADLVEILADPKHPEYQDRKSWHGPIHPEKFDAKKATKAMQHVKEGN